MVSNDVEDLLTCVVCLTPFVMPITLACGHTYCASHLDKMTGCALRCKAGTIPPAAQRHANIVLQQLLRAASAEDDAERDARADGSASTPHVRADPASELIARHHAWQRGGGGDDGGDDDDGRVRVSIRVPFGDFFAGRPYRSVELRAEATDRVFDAMRQLVLVEGGCLAVDDFELLRVFDGGAVEVALREESVLLTPRDAAAIFELHRFDDGP